MKTNIFLRIVYTSSIFAFSLIKPTELCPQDILEIMKKEHNAQDADQTIKNMVSNALTQCNMPEDFSVLTSSTTSDRTSARIRSLERNAPMDKFLILNTTNRTLNDIDYAIHHELGHIQHNHNAKKIYYKGQKYIEGIAATLSSLALTVYGGARYELPITYNALLSLAAMGLTGTGSYYYGKSACLKKSREFEKEADIFAYQHLIRQEKITVVLEAIADRLGTHYGQVNNIIRPPAKKTHPEALERARYGLQELKNHGYSIPDLINNLPPDIDAGIAEHLPDAAKKYCPEFFSDKKALDK